MQENYGRAAAGDIVENIGVAAQDLFHNEIIGKRRCGASLQIEIGRFAGPVPQMKYLHKSLSFVYLVINNDRAVHQSADICSAANYRSEIGIALKYFNMIKLIDRNAGRLWDYRRLCSRRFQPNLLTRLASTGAGSPLGKMRANF